MSVDWSSSESVLLLNPRLAPERARELERAWREHVEARFSGQIGIATSGSTGDEGGARLVALSKEAFLHAARAANERLRATSSDVWMKALPIFHVGGLAVAARASLSGSRAVPFAAEKWSSEEFHRALGESGATLLSLVPTQLFDLVRESLQAPKTVRAVIVGGGRLESRLREEALRLGWPVLPSYGMTECGSQVATAVSPDDPRLRPLSHVELRVGAEDRIEIRSRALLTGQLRFGPGGKAVFEDPKSIDGWFATSDRGRIEADGSLVVHGRTQDFVKIGGEGVLLSRLEETLERIRLSSGYRHDAALLAAADERLGARIVLVTDASDGLDARRLVDEFNSSVMPFERVRSVHSLEKVPRSPLGKLLRGEALAAIGLESLADA